MKIEEGFIQDFSYKCKKYNRAIIRINDLTLYAVDVPTIYKKGQFIQLINKDNIISIYDPIKLKKEKEQRIKKRIIKLKEYYREKKLEKSRKKIKHVKEKKKWKKHKRKKHK